MFLALFVSLFLSGGPSANPNSPSRVVSLAPNLTEYVCVLVGPELLVGVTDYCSFPEQVKKLPKVGGYLNPNLEVILSLRPDLVLALPEHKATTEKLRALGLRVEVVRNWTVADIFSGMEQIGELLGQSAKAKNLNAELRAQQATFTRTRTPKPRVLVVLDHVDPGGSSNTFYLVGRNGFLNELLELTGGQNAWTQEKPYFPSVSQEVLLSLDPDIIIELVPRSRLSPVERASKEALWHSIPFLRAGKEKVHIVQLEHILQAGPRYLDTLKALTTCLDAP